MHVILPMMMTHVFGKLLLNAPNFALFSISLGTICLHKNRVLFMCAFVLERYHGLDILNLPWPNFFHAESKGWRVNESCRCLQSL